MMKSHVLNVRAELLSFLDTHNIQHKTVDHPAVFTVDEGREMKLTMPGGHSKNLFLKDKKGRFFLVTAHADTVVDLVGLGKAIGAKGRLSFGKSDAMIDILGVSPGSVTPFAVINDREKILSSIVVDIALFSHDPVWFHPLENTASTAISPDGLMAFFKACERKVSMINLTNPLGDTENQTSS